MKTFDELVDQYLPLNEGLIVSYDVQKLKARIFELFKNKIAYAEITPSSEFDKEDSKYGTALTIGIFFKESLLGEERKKLEKILNVFGYYISFVNETGKSFQIEPRYTVEFIPKEWGVQSLYHITPKKNIPKIMKQGLLAKQSQTKFDHPPDRIYMFVAKTNDVLITWMKILAESKKINLDEMGVIEVKVRPYQKYYLDDTTTLDNILLAVYTTTAIPITDLKVIVG